MVAKMVWYLGWDMGQALSLQARDPARGCVGVNAGLACRIMATEAKEGEKFGVILHLLSPHFQASACFLQERIYFLQSLVYQACTWNLFCCK